MREQGGVGREGAGGREQRGEKREERGEIQLQLVLTCTWLSQVQMGTTYSEQPCHIRCMSSIHAPSRAWHTLTRLGGKRRELW